MIVVTAIGVGIAALAVAVELFIHFHKNDNSEKESTEQVVNITYNINYNSDDEDVDYIPFKIGNHYKVQIPDISKVQISDLVCNNDTNIEDNNVVDTELMGNAAECTKPEHVGTETWALM